MGIFIPDSLAGDVGRSMQGLARGVSRGAGTAATIIDDANKKYHDQQNLVEASRIENDMMVDKRKSLYDLSLNDDGTDAGYLDRVKSEDERIGQGYMSRASNDAVRNYLAKIHLHSQQLNISKAQAGQKERLWNTSLENAKIQTDNVIRKTAPYADFDGGIAAVDSYVRAQSGYFGAATEKIVAAMKARFAENMTRAALADPTTAPVMLRKLADQEEKTKIFQHIPADRLDGMEQLIKAGNASEMKRQGIDVGVSIFKNDKTGSLEAMTDAVRAKGLGVDVEKEAISQIKEMYVVRKHDEERYKKSVKDKYVKKLTDVALKRNGLNMPGDLSPSEWEELTAADPGYAAKLQDSMRREMDYQARQARADVREAAYERRMQQADNESLILISDDFHERDLKSDLAAGDISPAQYTRLLAAQERLDPVKRDSVRTALSKVNGGTALAKALGVKDKNVEAQWKLKYGELVKAWAYNHADDPDFDRKMTEFVDKQILSDMVTSWFSGDDADRLEKYKKAKGDAGELPQRGKKPREQATKKLVGYQKGKPVYDVGGGKWQVGE